MKSIKQIIACALLIFTAGLLSAQTINLHVSAQRFLDKDRNTYINIDYQIPYGDLVFLAHKGGYFAEVDVAVEAVQGDSVLFSKSIRDNIGISNKEDAASNKTYLNRDRYLLNSQPILFRITTTDLNSQKSGTWSFSAASLEDGALLSDLELCSEVRPDSSSFLDKFHRGKTLYQTQPSLIFDKNLSEFLSLYFEVYTAGEQRGEAGLLVLTVEKDSILMFDDFIDFSPRLDTEGLSLKIPLADLKPGRYEGSLQFQLGELLAEKEFTFFVTEPRQEFFFLLPNPDDDFVLLRYFMGSSLTADWKNYDEETKKRYNSQIWKTLANSNNLSSQAMLDLVRERVDYANRYYSHFDQGWKSDLGRIHIRNGKPDEIEKDTTSDETRYVRKDYQIWKYRGRLNAVYLFVDIQMNGNYKLIYVKNDESESSNPDYLRYLGDDFDTSILDN